MIEVLFSESETESMKVAKSIASKHTVSVAGKGYIRVFTSTRSCNVTIDIQHLSNIQSEMLKQIKKNYQKEINSLVMLCFNQFCFWIIKETT